MRIIIGVSGATGVIMSYYLLRALKEVEGCETHLVVSDYAKLNWELETDLPFQLLLDNADKYYDVHNLAAAISSGSYKTDGMIIMPCSMKTLAGIVSGYTDNLLVRAADVCIKENRKVVLCTREMPLSKIHLRNMQAAADFGCTIIPPMLTFYNSPQSLDDQINHVVGKTLMQFGIDHKSFVPWNGVN
jgi:4-hydroxy-3-polyprenylbenzoate decarboxylase